MGEKKPFHRGEHVFVRTKSAAGLTEHEAKVKEMAGSRDVAVEIYGRDRVVKLCDVRKAGIPAPDNWLGSPDEWLGTAVRQSSYPPPVPVRKPQSPPMRPRKEKPAKRVLSATLGESIMAKTTITPPPHFGSPPVACDPSEIGAVVRRERVANGLTVKTAAKMLRIQERELELIESTDEVPSDEVVLRFSDVLSCPLDPLSTALEYTRKRVLEDEARRLQALELGRKTEEAKAKKLAEEKEKSPIPVTRAASESPRRTLEDFGERLMDVAPVPVDATRRKQWWTCARILFELEGA